MSVGAGASVASSPAVVAVVRTPPRCVSVSAGLDAAAEWVTSAAIHAAEAYQVEAALGVPAAVAGPCRIQYIQAFPKSLVELQPQSQEQEQQHAAATQEAEEELAVCLATPIGESVRPPEPIEGLDETLQRMRYTYLQRAFNEREDDQEEQAALSERYMRLLRRFKGVARRSSKSERTSRAE